MYEGNVHAYVYMHVCMYVTDRKRRDREPKDGRKVTYSCTEDRCVFVCDGGKLRSRWMHVCVLEKDMGEEEKKPNKGICYARNS